jgi:ribosomal protein S18 acetylase RimI-like enzyme
VAVHKDYRGKGLATLLLKKVEEFVRKNNGRYIHVLTCDISSYDAARHLYEINGYKKVTEIPDYYVVGEGRVDYIKYL